MNDHGFSQETIDAHQEDKILWEYIDLDKDEKHKVLVEQHEKVKIVRLIRLEQFYKNRTPEEESVLFP